MLLLKSKSLCLLESYCSVFSHYLFSLTDKDCLLSTLSMTSKGNSTSTLVANMWLSTESFLLSLSRLECPKAVFWAQYYS